MRSSVVRCTDGSYRLAGQEGLLPCAPAVRGNLPAVLPPNEPNVAVYVILVVALLVLGAMGYACYRHRKQLVARFYSRISYNNIERVPLGTDDGCKEDLDESDSDESEPQGEILV